jgi:predicted anti-sigma-YlaC factor YlaD
MNCRECRSAIADLVLDAAGAEVPAALRDHLAACAACRAEEASLRESLRALGRLDTVEDPSDVAAIITAARAADARRPVALRRVRRFALAAAIMLVVALVAVGTEISVADGRVVIALGRAPAPAPDDRAAIRALAREAADAAIERSAGAIVQAMDDALRVRDRAGAERDDVLYRELSDEIARIHRVLDVLAENTLRHEDGMVALARHIERNPAAAAP